MPEPQAPQSRHSFTGRTVSRKPAPRILLADRWAGWVITASGIGGILAVSLVGLFLLWVALPLLLPTKVELQNKMLPPGGSNTGSQTRIRAQAMDTYGSMVWSLLDQGLVVVQSLSSGLILKQIPIEAASSLTCNSDSDNGRLALGFADGTVTLAEFSFKPQFLNELDVPPEMRKIARGESKPWAGGILTRTPEGMLRHLNFILDVEAPLAVSDTTLALVDITANSSGYVLAAVDAANIFYYKVLKIKTNMLTGKKSIRSSGTSVPLSDFGLNDYRALVGLKVNDTGHQVIIVTQDGDGVLVENTEGHLTKQGTSRLVEGPDVQVTALGFLAGHVSLAVGDSHGNISVWFPVSGSGGQPGKLTLVHQLQPGPAAVTSLANSQRSRMLAAGFENGEVKVYNVTAHRLLGSFQTGYGPVRHLTISPREEGIMADGDSGTGLLSLEAPYGEISVHSLLQPVWYEGYPGPAYVWQSSSASDSFEPKMSLIPLIFGTLKATFYSLLFGLPLAIMAALYTSEFLPRKSRIRVKPIIEVMASLPSVVLGFLAALVIAPLVENVAVEVISALFLIPVFVLWGAHLWQLLPREISARWASFRPGGILLAMVFGVWASWAVGPTLERFLFAGDLKLWLDGQVGSGAVGWIILLLPLTGMVCGWLNIVYGDGLIRNLNPNWSYRSVALVDLGRFLLSIIMAMGLAIFVGWLLNEVGWDPRGSVLGTYVQRNALVVGIAMGFAIIPLIYSLSEDALVSVPDHLRAGSLGAGATTWQTAVRVVIPPAMSGLFSAAMVGIGRAVGETMIVLMAAGNTPIMDLNIFNGFRTLSANLAVELPEAVQDSTHYRVLFLAALVLFSMTFVLNTIAEGVRLHFRRKTSRL